MSDEFSCPSDTCPRDQWHCGTGLCIPVKYRCDGMAQCSDLSDEVSCDCDQDNMFRCDTGHVSQCVDTMFVCDGWIHCLDGLDELNCKIDCQFSHLGKVDFYDRRF